MRVDGRLRLEEAVFGHHICEIQIRLIKRADRSDVLPVTLKDKRADMSIFDRQWNNVFPEIGHVVLQRFYKHVPVEDVDPHRRLE